MVFCAKLKAACHEWNGCLLILVVLVDPVNDLMVIQMGTPKPQLHFISASKSVLFFFWEVVEVGVF